MTDLQLGLISLGGGAVVAVLAYNKWQEYRHRKVAEQVMRRDHDDVLLGNPKRQAPDGSVPEQREEPALRREPALPPAEEIAEPVLLVEDRVPVSTVDELEAAPELPRTPAVAGNMPDVPVMSMGDEAPDAFPVLEEMLDAETLDALSTLPAGEVPLALLDPRIDFIAAFDLVELVPALQIMQSQRDGLVRLKKAVRWVGFNERLREWEVMSPENGRAYRRLRVGLQLADRRGPLSEADFTLFVAAMQQLADDLMAVVDMAPSTEILRQALEIDRFCADVDLEIGIHLISKAVPFAGTKIRALAEAAGMILGADGLFTRYDDEGRALFSLQNLESTLFVPEAIKSLSTRGLTFLLDVPRTGHGERVFFQMLDLARRFADALQGLLVDDNRQPLTEAQLDHIKREYVLKPQVAMANYGFAAGGPQALRLFS